MENRITSKQQGVCKIFQYMVWYIYPAEKGRGKP